MSAVLHIHPPHRDLMSNRDDDDIDGAIDELLAYRKKVEDFGKSVVERYKKLLDNPERLEAGYSKAFAAEHGKWYDAIEKELTAVGFRPLGAYQNVNRDTPDESRSFYR